MIPGTMLTRVLVFNGNTNRADAVKDWLLDIDPDIALICETGTLRSMYRKVGRLYFSADDVPTDPSVLIRRRGPVRASYGKLTDRVHRDSLPNMWRDRWYVRVREVSRNTVNISTHANALIHDNGHWRNNAGADEWRYKGLTRLATKIKQVQRNGRAVRIGADMNFPRAFEVPDSPNKFFKRLGLEYFDRGLMWFAYDPKYEKIVKARAIERPPGADAHHALVIDLETR